jgi:stage II sporulation protein AA (anti-sigma F factor antagonist)
MIQLTHALYDRTLLVTVAGDLDLETAPHLRAAVDAELERSQAAHLLLDLSAVGFLDSSGLGAILGRYRTVTAAGGRMGIAGARDAVRRVLRLSGIARIISLYATSETGLRDLARGRRSRAARSARVAGDDVEVMPGGR